MMPNTSDSWYRKYVLGMLNDLSPKLAEFALSKLWELYYITPVAKALLKMLLATPNFSMVMVDRGRRRSEELPVV